MNLFISNSKIKQKYNINLFYVIIFVLLLISSFIICELLNRKFITEKTVGLNTLKDYNSSKENIQILIIGNSHFYGINPDIFIDETFSFVAGGTNYYQVYYFLKNNIEKMPNLKSIIIQADPSSWSSFDATQINNPLLWNRFIDYNELSKHVGASILKHKYHLTLIHESFGRKYFIKNLRDFIKENFFGINLKPTKKEIKERLLSAKHSDWTRKRIIRHFLNHEIFDKRKLLYFQKILMLCKKYQIPLITIQMPHRRDYILFANDYITIDDIKNNIIENPQYENYIMENINCLNMFNNHDEYFANADHLNEDGRDSLSKFLSNKIYKILK